MSDKLTDLSRTVSYALRHKPGEFGLTLDPEGWVDMAELVLAIGRRKPKWRDVTSADIAAADAAGSKRRFEIEGGRIRALYGHSVSETIVMTPQAPPTRLYHGTTGSAVREIRKTGLLPMRRQKVHLSTDRETATIVAKRRKGDVVIITIVADEAAAADCRFYRRSDGIWLADAVPLQFLEIPD